MTSKPGSKSGAARGFTLIEMLVVIAIISILASMLSGPLMNALEASRIAACLNNHKQLGLCNLMYAEDNNDHVATAVPPNHRPWYRTLPPYSDSTNSLWCCPSTAVGAEGPLGTPAEKGESWNRMRDYSGTGLNHWGFSGVSADNQTLRIRRLHNFPAPSQMIFTGECITGVEFLANGGNSNIPAGNTSRWILPNMLVGPTISNISYSGYYLRHQNTTGINLGFLDGHAATIPSGEFLRWIDGATVWPKVADCYRHFAP